VFQDTQVEKEAMLQRVLSAEQQLTKANSTIVALKESVADARTAIMVSSSYPARMCL
jgi:hypothetical protein